MHNLEPEKIAQLLIPYLGDAAVPERLLAQLAVYLDLLMKWNTRTNLTAIRDPEEIVRRHFGESLFAGLHLPAEAKTLLDFGSGAGFPGLPIQLLRPQLAVTLAESQGKKASFLREAVRSLSLETEVWADRVEAIPATRQFDVVALRAVDKMEAAVAISRHFVRVGGVLAVLTAGDKDGVSVPGTSSSVLQIIRL